MDRIPGMSLRLNAHKENLGGDISQCGEVAYGYMEEAKSQLEQMTRANSANELNVHEQELESQDKLNQMSEQVV
jgi:hypothetical protein